MEIELSMTVAYGLGIAISSLLVLLVKRKFGWFAFSSVKNSLHTAWQAPLVVYLLLQSMMIIAEGEFLPFLNDGFGFLLVFFIIGTCALWVAIIYANVMEKFVMERCKNVVVEYFLFVITVFPIAYVFQYLFLHVIF